MYYSLGGDSGYYGRTDERYNIIPAFSSKSAGIMIDLIHLLAGAGMITDGQ